MRFLLLTGTHIHLLINKWFKVNNAQNVWIDHNTFSNGSRTDDHFPPVFEYPYNQKEQKVQHHDGLVAITNGSTKVTISYNIFKDHDKTNLLGGK